MSILIKPVLLELLLKNFITLFILIKDHFTKKHINTFQNDNRRTISVVCYLNQDWQDCFKWTTKTIL